VTNIQIDIQNGSEPNIKILNSAFLPFALPGATTETSKEPDEELDCGFNLWPYQ